MKLVPNAKPALDCPVLFPYSPNAVIVGFITTTIGSVIAMFTLPLIGFVVIVPGMLTNFFAGGTAGIFGKRGRWPPRSNHRWSCARPLHHAVARATGDHIPQSRFPQPVRNRLRHHRGRAVLRLRRRSHHEGVLEGVQHGILQKEKACCHAAAC